MRTLRNILLAVIAAATGLLPFVPGDARAQGGSDTAFTYQGFLRDDGDPASGEFRMVFELLESGTPDPVAPPVIGPVEVTDGVFTVKLDFGSVFNGPPVDLHILIDVDGQLVPLDPPQRICPTPLAMRAASAESVDSVPDTALSSNVPIIVNNSLGLPGTDASLRFGPLGECRIGVDPRFPGLVESDPIGFRLLGQDNQGCRLIFGPTMDCTVEVDPLGPPGLLLRDPSGIRIIPPDPGLPRLLFGPTDDCSIGIEPDLLGLAERDPTGFRLLGQNNQGCRLIFGPTMDCTVEIDPQGPSGLLLRDPSGIRILDPSGNGIPQLIFGPTDDCRIGLEPDLPGLAERDPTGFRLLGQDNQGCRLIFGPTMDCTVEIDPQGPSGLLLRDPSGIRILDPSGNGIPQLIFGPTDECRISVDPERGLLLRDPRGITLPFPTDPTGQLLPAVLTMGDVGECRWRVNAPGAGPKGMILEDPAGLRLLGPDGVGNTLTFGPTDECRIFVDPERRNNGLIVQDVRPILFENPLEPGGAVVQIDGILIAENVQPSSRRYKENIQTIANPLEVIEQLEGVTFDWKEERGGQPSIGFIAEEVGKILPEVVAFEADGVNARGVNYGHLVAVTVEGIKQQQSQIETQQSEIENLRSENAALEQRLERLEKLMQQSPKKEADDDRRL